MESTYKKELMEIKNRHEKEISDFNVQYAASRAKYKKGQIIISKQTIIKIDELSAGFKYLSEEPQMRYIGKELTKKLEPRKDKSKRAVFQSDVLEVFDK